MPERRKNPQKVVENRKKGEIFFQKSEKKVSRKREKAIKFFKSQKTRKSLKYLWKLENQK